MKFKDKTTRSELLINQLCDEIDELTAALQISQINEEHWRDEYNKLLDESLAHSKIMLGNVLAIAMKGNA